MPLHRPRLGFRQGPHINYDKYLSPGEETNLEVRRHWAALLWPAALLLAALLIGSFLGAWLSPGTNSDPVDTVAFLVVMFFLLRFGWKLFEWQIDRILVTNRRVVEVSGLITRRVASMPLTKVTDLTYKRTPLGRGLGFGELAIESAGQKQALEAITYIPRPDQFYRAFADLLNAAGPHRAPDEEDTGPIPRVHV